MKKNFKFFIFLLFCFFATSASKAEVQAIDVAPGMNIKIGSEYVGINSVESKYLAYTKIKEIEKNLYRLKQSTSTFEFVRKTTAEQREEIEKKITELEGILSNIDEDNVTGKDYAKIRVKLQNIIDEIDMIDNILDYTYGFAPKFMIKTGLLISSKYMFVTPAVIDANIYYQLNSFVNPFVGMGFSVPILLNHRNEILASGYSVLTYAMLIDAKFGNLFKFHKQHYVSLFFKIGSLFGHQSVKVTSTTVGNERIDVETEKIIARTNPLGESIITGVGLEYFFKNKLVVGLNFDVYHASNNSPVKKKTNFVLGINVGYNFCSGNKSRFSTNSSGRTSIYKTIWE